MRKHRSCPACVPGKKAAHLCYSFPGGIMDLTKLSGQYIVRLLTEDDIPAVYTLCSTNPLYYQYFPEPLTEESIRADMHILPPHTPRNDKYYAGYFSTGRLIAVLDLICGYPDPATAFIGFFMTDRAIQHRGIGSRIITDLCSYLKEEGFLRIRLAFVSTNPQAAHFWHKNGFTDTGQVYEQEHYTLTAAERML